MAAIMNAVHEYMDDDTNDTEEYSESYTFVESSIAVNVGTNEENSSSGRRQKDTVSELLKATVQEAHVDQEPPSFIDPDDLEMEDDDITSKLLSIQVLPRIPKRKPAAKADSSSTSVGESSSHYSVLERVNSTTGFDVARYPNWSAAGWRRSNVDRPVQSWSRKSTKDRKVESKPIKRTMTEKPPDRDSQNKTEISRNKLKRASEYSAWSVDESDVSSCPRFSEIEQVASDETAAPSLTGPLPTLPFEEQMRERARLRKLKKQGGCDVVNNSVDSTETALKNFSNGDSSKDSFSIPSTSNFHSDKAETTQSIPSQARRDTEFQGSVNSTLLLRAKIAEHHQSSHRHRSENGHHHGHRSKKPNHQPNVTHAKDKTNQLHFTGAQDNQAVESTLKSKKETASPPLPHLPVLPLFATSETQASDSSLHPVKRKSLGRKSVSMSLSEQNASAQNDAHDVSSSFMSQLKSGGFAASGAKSVTFSSDTASQDGNKTKKNSKPKVG